MSEKRAVPFVVYKGKGALRLQLLPAEPKEEGSPYLKEGCVMLEMANAGETQRTYDWENKIVFKMSSKDIGEVLAYLKFGAKGEVKLIHDSSKAPGAAEGAGIKSLSITATEKSWFWNLQAGKDNRRSVPVDLGELVRIQQLLKKGLETIYGW